MFRLLHKPFLYRIIVDILQLLIKKRPTRNSDRMVSRLPDSVLSPFFAVKNLHLKELAKLPQIAQIVLNLFGGMPLQIADDVGDLVVAFVADNGVLVFVIVHLTLVILGAGGFSLRRMPGGYQA